MSLITEFMNDILNKSIVLVLNRNWQAINIRTPQEAFCQMATNVATGLEIESENHIRPVSWDEWITLPIRPQDNAVHTVRGAIRVPTVIVAMNYAKVPKKRPKLCAKNIRERDGNRCQYTGKLLKPDEGSLDHVLPRSRGGADTWENLVWSSKEVNTRKADRLPHEAGLKLLSVPRAPKELPVTATIRNAHGIPEWKLFMQE
jgi:5-methylcytosine-specific restriction endonuclease McrA